MIMHFFYRIAGAVAVLLPTAFQIALPGRVLANDLWLVVVNETCGNANGSIQAVTSGTMIFPLTYAWSNGATTEIITGVPAGNYSVLVTDAMGTSLWEETDVFNVSFLTDIGGGDYGQPIDLLTGHNGLACPGQCNGSRSFPFVDGTGPYAITWTDPGISFLGSSNGFSAYTGFCHGVPYGYTVTDAYGCPGTGSFTDDLIEGTSEPFIISVEGACGGGANGAVVVDVNFGWFPASSLSVWQGGVDISSQVIFTYQGSGVYRISGFAAGPYEYQQDAGTASEPSECAVLLPFLIDDLGNSCGNVSGTLFLDHGQDCFQDVSDPGVAYRVLEIGPGAELAITNADGSYTRNLPLGAHTLAPQGSDLFPLCPAVSPAPFLLTGAVPLAVLDLADSSLVDLDIAAWLQAGPARPGFIHTVHAEVRNNSGQLSGPLDVTLIFDPTMNFVNAVPTPSNVVGNTITWSAMAPLSGYGVLHAQVDLQVPPNAGLVGTPIQHSLTVSQALPETNLSNNTIAWAGTITASFDPNDKVATTSSRTSSELYYIDQDEWIDYTIRFQNTGTDTAFTVTITDTLSPYLDMATYEQGLASHAFNVSFKPQRVVEWSFQDILLPDSNVNEARSHGLVSFRIRPSLPLSPGTSIENIANIYFDFNEPVITEPSVLVAEYSTNVQDLDMGELRLMPNPASDQLRLSDASLGSSILSWSVISVGGRILLGENRPLPATGIEIDNLPEGVYILRLSTSDQQFNIRFVKVTYP